MTSMFFTARDTDAQSGTGGWIRRDEPSFEDFAMELERRGRECIIPTTREAYFKAKAIAAQGGAQAGKATAFIAKCKAANGGFSTFIYSSDKRRKADIVGYSPMVAIDCDAIPADQWGFVLTNAVVFLGRSVIYLTASDGGESAKVRKARIIVALDRAPTSAAEWEGMARSIARRIDPEMGGRAAQGQDDWIDPASFRLNQLMYWPAHFQGEQGGENHNVFTSLTEPPLSVDGIIAEDYPEGLTARTAGKFRTSQEVRELGAGRTGATNTPTDQKASDPHTRGGVIGAFNRAFTAEQVLQRWGEGKYRQTDGSKDRWDWIGGGTGARGGLQIFPDGLAFSRDATSPLTTGHCTDAFGIMAALKFGEDSTGAVRYAASLDEVRHILEADTEADIISSINKATGSVQSAEKEQEEQTPDHGDGEAQEATDKAQEELVFTDAGTLRPCRQNVVAVFERSPALMGAGVHRDIFAETIAVDHPERLPWASGRSADQTWTDQDDAMFRLLLEMAGLRVPAATQIDGLEAIATKYARDPARELFKTLKWDGTPRIETALIDYLGAEDTPYTRETLKRCMIAESARILHPGKVKFDPILLLIGPQGCGKSVFCQRLAINDAWFTSISGDVADQDTRDALRGRVVAEFGELVSLSKGDQNRNKQFISADADDYREKYGRRVTRHVRRVMIIGTTNEDSPLSDVTGNRRYLPVRVTKVPGSMGEGVRAFEMDQQTVLQMWAEAVHLAEADDTDETGRPCKAWQVVGRFPDWFERKAVEAQETAAYRDELRDDIIRYLETAWPKEARGWGAGQRARYFMWRTGSLPGYEQKQWAAESGSDLNDDQLTTDWYIKIVSIDDEQAVERYPDDFEKMDATSVTQIWKEVEGNYSKAISNKEAARIRNVMSTIDGWEVDPSNRTKPPGSSYLVTGKGYRRKPRS